jgi:hypothetical protein
VESESIVYSAPYMGPGPEPVDNLPNAATARPTNSQQASVYVTYTKYNPTTGETYVGRSMGFGDPKNIVAARDAGHHKNEQGFGPAVLDRSTQGTLPFAQRQLDPAYQAIRGREQIWIDTYGGAWSTAGRGNTQSGNAINGISPYNPMWGIYMSMGLTLGPVPPPSPASVVK